MDKKYLKIAKSFGFKINKKYLKYIANDCGIKDVLLYQTDVDSFTPNPKFPFKIMNVKQKKGKIYFYLIHHCNPTILWQVQKNKILLKIK